MDLDARVQHSCEHAELTTEFGAIKIASRHTIRLFRISLAEEFSSRKLKTFRKAMSPACGLCRDALAGDFGPFKRHAVRPHMIEITS